MTEATNGQKTIAHTLLSLQTTYTLTFGSDLPDEEKNPKLDEIASTYANELVRFFSTTNGGSHSMY